ncbi:MAG: SEC-C metal-binding domain-containing protein, partial [Spongiibacter sp.]
VRFLSHLQLQQNESAEALEQKRRDEQAARAMEFQHAETSALAAEEEPAAAGDQASAPETFVRDGRKVGRNEPCPCGSGKKYKQCHGKLD